LVNAASVFRAPVRQSFWAFTSRTIFDYFWVIRRPLVGQSRRDNGLFRASNGAMDIEGSGAKCSACPANAALKLPALPSELRPTYLG
jgi:hypothetical protein